MDTERDGGRQSDDSHTGDDPRFSRRTVLATATLGVFEWLAACLGGDGDGDDGATTTETDPPTSTRTPANTPSPTDGRALAEAFAPDIYFDSREKWFPTDPRALIPDGATTVDGFGALDAYTAGRRSAGGPPFATVFYHVVDVAPALTVVQYWFYSAFDQFTTNFHWHDWEALHVWLDTSSEPQPVLVVGSAHARSMPNNEFLDPGIDRASVIAELGSHSSAIGVNATLDRFERYGSNGDPADVTNAAVAAVAGAAGVPLAYGLPRDEGFRIPFVLPTLDGGPIYDHPSLTNVARQDLLPTDLTVESFLDLAQPPSSLPPREPGIRFVFEGSTAADGPNDVRYTLEPTSDVEYLADFTGPRLSFPFYVPGFVEDRIASHISAASFPWNAADENQRRYDEPIHDVTDVRHREELARRYDVAVPEAGGQVVGEVQQMQPESAAPQHGGLAFVTPGVEVVALFESTPVAVPSTRGRIALVDVSAGEHRLTVNGPGFAPYAQRLTVAPDDDLVRAGAGGRVALVANAERFKLAVDASGRGGVARLRVRDDYAGTVYDAPTVERGARSAVYLHRSGAYVVEVTDVRGDVSVERVRPDGATDSITAGETTTTGKGSIVEFLVEFLGETLQLYDEQTITLRRQEADVDFEAVATIGAAFETALGDVSLADSLLGDGVVERADALVEAARGELLTARSLARNADDGLPIDLRRFVLRRVQVADSWAGRALDAPVRE